MKSAVSRRYRRFSSSKEQAANKKDSAETFFSETGPQSFFPPVNVQRKCTDCEKEEKKADLLKEKKKEDKVVVVVADKDKDKKKLLKKEDEKLLKKDEDEKKKKKEEKIIVVVADKEKDKKKLFKKEEEKEIKKKESGGAAVASGAAGIHNYVSSLNGKGSTLSAPSQEFFGSKMNADFSNVRIHKDKEASESAAAINAKAYTVGDHIVFNEGEFNESTDTGKKLLAHELAHVVQQKGNP